MDPNQVGSQGSWAMSPQLADFMAFFQDLPNQMGNFEATPEWLDAMAQIIPIMGLYSQFANAQYQQDYLDFLYSEMGLKGEELNYAKQQLDFQSGPYFEWYTQQFFPQAAALEESRMANELQQMGYQTQISKNQLGQSAWAYEQERQQTAQAKMATEVARYQALQQMGMGQTNRTADGRTVRGSGFSYGYQGY